MSLKLPRLEPHRSLRTTLVCLLALTLAGTLARRRRAGRAAAPSRPRFRR